MAATNDRWMHLYAGDITVRNVLQYVWKTTSRVSTYSVFLLALSHVVQESAGQDADMTLLSDIVSLFTRQSFCFVAMLRFWRRLDHILYDIPIAEETVPRLLSRRRYLRINDLSDTEAHKMTHFFMDSCVDCTMRLI